MNRIYITTIIGGFIKLKIPYVRLFPMSVRTRQEYRKIASFDSFIDFRHDEKSGQGVIWPSGESVCVSGYNMAVCHQSVNIRMSDNVFVRRLHCLVDSPKYKNKKGGICNKCPWSGVAIVDRSLTLNKYPGPELNQELNSSAQLPHEVFEFVRDRHISVSSIVNEAGSNYITFGGHVHTVSSHLNHLSRRFKLDSMPYRRFR